LYYTLLYECNGLERNASLLWRCNRSSPNAGHLSPLCLTPFLLLAQVNGRSRVVSFRFACFVLRFLASPRPSLAPLTSSTSTSPSLSSSPFQSPSLFRSTPLSSSTSLSLFLLPFL
ncbi:unnamed protein product, partial [Laminaria digitata]